LAWRIRICGFYQLGKQTGKSGPASAHNNYRGLFMIYFQYRKIVMTALVAAVAINTLTTKLQAHGLEGDRFFPPTPLTDDPFAVDELSLPEIQYNPAAASKELDVNGAFTKEIFPKFALTISDTYINLNPKGGPAQDGFSP
jgi:hypothetical protein